jgi:hypothetical protein
MARQRGAKAPREYGLNRGASIGALWAGRIKRAMTVAPSRRSAATLGNYSRGGRQKTPRRARGKWPRRLNLVPSPGATAGGITRLVWAVGARLLPWACQTKGRRVAPFLHINSAISKASQPRAAKPTPQKSATDITVSCNPTRETWRILQPFARTSIGRQAKRPPSGPS